MYGDYFISYVLNEGYEKYLLTFGDTLCELMNNMNKLHAHVASTMENAKMPSIHCEKCDEEDTFFLHYSSPRGGGLACLMVGMVKSVAKSYFSREVTLTELARQGDAAGSPATIWKVRLARVVVMSETYARILLMRFVTHTYCCVEQESHSFLCLFCIEYDWL
jgi:hypothetical protein